MLPENLYSTYHQRTRGDNEDDFLAFQLLLADLHGLRSVVARTWTEYGQGLLDVATASLVTETAVNLARSLEDECRPRYVKYGGLRVMLDFVYENRCVAQGQDAFYREQLSDDFNVNTYDTFVDIFLFSYGLLTTFMDVQQPGMLPEWRPGQHDEYHPESDRSIKTAREKFHEDRVIILQMLPEFMALTTVFRSSPVEDELTRGLRNMFLTRQVTLSLAFATQLFVDIHNGLRDRVHTAFFKLSTVTAFAQDNIGRNSQFHERSRIDIWSSKGDKQMIDFSGKLSNNILSDPHLVASRYLMRTNIPPPYYFLLQHPWASGLWKFYVQTQLHTLSATFVGAWGAITACVHLYNAVRQERLLELEWPDMSLLFATRGSKSFFNGDAPSRLEDYFKCLAMAMQDNGTDAESSTTAESGMNITRSNSGPRGFGEIAPGLRSFSKKYCLETGTLDLDFNVEDVDAIVQRSGWQHKIYQDPSLFVSVIEFANGKAMHVNVLLRILRWGIQSEIPGLSFDYLTFHHVCWNLLQSIQERCHSQLIRLFGSRYLEDANLLPKIVDRIFKGSISNIALLKDAASIIEGMLRNGGGDVVGKVIRENVEVPVVPG